ncbi:MAG: chorismate synthase [Deltaproteobacteria bacterium GWA2_50_8]|nr:MAG: chorismate synthase [Deltaproteobacteria bacterium GWA2_50_8]
MSSLHYHTAGESHGPMLTAILEGMPSGVSIAEASINEQLKRRQGGYGRGQRMQIESDHVKVTSGIRFGKTLGSPIALQVENKDWKNWMPLMSPFGRPSAQRAVHCPRPGHADLAGGIKYDHHDLRNILERASARETTMRVAIGALVRQLLEVFDIRLYSYVRSIGDVSVLTPCPPLKKLQAFANQSPVHTYDSRAAKKMMALIDQVRKKQDSLGGTFEVIVTGVPIGLGSHVNWEKKLDALLAQSVMSLQAIKAVEIGLGVEAGRRWGSKMHDEIFFSRARGFYHKTNNAGGLTGGMTNGNPIVVRATIKPISTLYQPLRSVDVVTKRPVRATIERSDICVVPAAAVIAENIVAYTIAQVFLEKFGGDSLHELKRHYSESMKLQRYY